MVSGQTTPSYFFIIYGEKQDLHGPMLLSAIPITNSIRTEMRSSSTVFINNIILEKNILIIYKTGFRVVCIASTKLTSMTLIQQQIIVKKSKYNQNCPEL